MIKRSLFLGKEGKPQCKYVSFIRRMNPAEASSVAIASSCGISKRNSNSHRVSSVEHGYEFMTSKTDFAFFYWTLSQCKIIFQFISSAFRYFCERG